MAAHGNVADQVYGLEHPCERLLLASLDSDLQQVDLFDAYCATRWSSVTLGTR